MGEHQPDQQSQPSQSDPGVAEALEQLNTVDLTAEPQQLLGTLSAIHDQLATRLRAAEG